ncbi:hypothetical protein V6Z11_D08G252000 [Gossypium hirsutum]
MEGEDERRLLLRLLSFLRSNWFKFKRSYNIQHAFHSWNLHSSFVVFSSLLLFSSAFLFSL